MKGVKARIQAQIYQDVVAFNIDDVAEKNISPMSKYQRLYRYLLVLDVKVWRMNFREGTGDPVRSSYFSGLSSISVAKWWIVYEEVRVTRSSKEVIEIWRSQGVIPCGL